MQFRRRRRQPPPHDAPGNIPNYLIWSILNTVGAFILCCLSCFSFPALVTGIVAIVFSSQVNTKLNQSDLAGARRSSANAKLWNWITSGILILALIGTIAMFSLVGMDGYMQYMEEVRQQMEQNR